MNEEITVQLVTLPLADQLEYFRAGCLTYISCFVVALAIRIFRRLGDDSHSPEL